MVTGVLFPLHLDAPTVLSVIGLLVVLRWVLKTLWFVYAHFLRPGVDLRKYGKWAVVTGSTDGIGEAYAKELARKGLNVVLISRSEEKLKAVANDIATKYPKVQTKTIAVDFATDKKDIYAKITAQLAGIEVGVLVNNVGVSYEHAEYFTDISEETVDRLIQVNIKAATHLTRALLPAMKERKKGAVIFIGSISGLFPAPLLAVYSASKAYVDFLARCLSEEYKSSGIFIQCTAPALVATKMSKVRRPKLAIPSATTFAKSAVSTIGHDHAGTGYWFHDIQNGILQSLPESQSLSYLYKQHVDIRRRALAKKQ